MRLHGRGGQGTVMGAEMLAQACVLGAGFVGILKGSLSIHSPCAKTKACSRISRSHGEIQPSGRRRDSTGSGVGGQAAQPDQVTYRDGQVHEGD